MGYPVKSALITLLVSSLVTAGCSQTARVRRPVDQLVEARALTKAGKPDEAYASFDEILKREPTNLTAHRGLVEAGYYAGKLADLEMRYRELTRQNDMRGLGHYGLALLGVARGPGHKETALAEFQKAREQMPNEADVPYRMGLVHLMDGRYLEAEKVIAEAMKLDPDRAGIRVAYADALVQLGREDQAIACLRRILVLSPSTDEARKARVIAGKVFDPLRDIPPEVATDLRNITDHLVQDSVQQALVLVEKLIAKHPNVAFAYTLKGLAHSRLENNGEAIVAYERTLKLLPNSPAALVGLGDVYARLEKWGKARDYFDKAVQIDPFDLEAHQRMGDMAMMRSDPDRAANAFANLVLLAPERVDFRHKWAMSLVTSGQTQQAVAVYEAILDLKAEDMEALIRLAALHLGLGERDPLTRDVHRNKAVNYLNQAHEINPDNQAVIDLLTKLEE